MSILNKQALDLYVYAFPLVFNIRQIKRYVSSGVEGTGGAGFNQFSHSQRLADATSKFVTVNNDTIYSFAGINLSNGPLILELPEATEDQYYVGQFIDAWTNNFAYVGSRATKGKHTKIYLVPPSYNGTLPRDYPVITFPTTVGCIIMRYAIDDIANLKSISALQEQTLLSQLYPENTSPFDLPEPLKGPTDLAFFNEALSYMSTYPASKNDQLNVESHFTSLELGKYPLLSKDILESLQHTAKNGETHLLKLLSEKKKSHSYINGWDTDLHAFDYNDSFFEIGAMNTPEFVIENREQAILTRALSAIGGLWGNNAYEAAYFFLWEDSTAQPLIGSKNYVLTFSNLPPVDAFWSVTMYDVPDFYLIENEYNRYSIGSNTKDLKYNADGSLSIYMSSQKPSNPDHLSNWLPAPPNQFRPVLRMYLPHEQILSGVYELPCAIKIED